MQSNKERKEMKTFIKVLKATFFYGGFLAVILGIAATVHYVEEGFDIVGIAGSLMAAVLGGHVMNLYKPEL
jgi:hypothetical protein